MNLITVIPIARGIGKETLTYFSSDAPVEGSIVEVDLRNRKIHGIVIESSPAESKKTEIKKLAYNLKKIDKIQSKQFLLPQFMVGARALADYYATSTGAVLSVLMSKVILEAIDELTHATSLSVVQTRKIDSGEVVAIQASDEERYSAYKSLIREEFARKKSVCIILPSREEIKFAKEKLYKGIEPYTFVLESALPKKEIITIWKKILDTSHPVLIIATGYFLSIPRDDIGSVIVENESSRGYTQIARPFLDLRTTISLLSKYMGWRVILGDTALRVETIFREKENEIAALSPLKFRVLSSAECILSDARTPKNQTKKEFEYIGKQLSELIDHTKTENDNLFLFCARKGLSPLTVCADCGDTVSCENCNAPVVLYGRKSSDGKATSSNYFLCQRCGHKRPADILCKRCGSWKLTPLGIGLESAEREIKKKFPSVTVFIMDKDHIKTHKQAEMVAKKFYDTPGSVLLGTEMAIPYIKEKIGNTGIISLDSFFSIPDFRIQEKIMNIILALRSRALKKVVVQTRRPDEKIFDYALKGNVADFYRDEIEERKQFGYPPFNTFIKISLEGPKVEIRAKMQKLKDECKEMVPSYDLTMFDAFHPGMNRQSIVHGLFMLQRHSWPEPVLLEKLRSLSPQFVIKIDPETLL